MKKTLKVALGILFLLIIISFAVVVAFVFVGDEESVDKVETFIEKSVEPKKEVVKKDNGVTYTVNSIEEVEKIVDLGGYSETTPNAEGSIFMVVNLTVTNGKKESTSINMDNFKLVTTDGLSYEATTMIGAAEKYFIYDTLNPGLTTSGNFAFEVPPGLKGLELHITPNLFTEDLIVVEIN